MSGGNGSSGFRLSSNPSNIKEDMNNLDLERLAPPGAADDRHNLAKELFGVGFPDLGLMLMFVLETFGVALPDFMLSKLMFVLETFGVGLADR